MFRELDRTAEGDHGRRGVVEIVRGGWSGGGERVGGGRGGVEGLAWGRRDDGGMVGRGGVCVLEE